MKETCDRCGGDITGAPSVDYSRLVPDEPMNLRKDPKPLLSMKVSCLCPVCSSFIEAAIAGRPVFCRGKEEENVFLEDLLGSRNLVNAVVDSVVGKKDGKVEGS